MRKQTEMSRHKQAEKNRHKEKSRGGENNGFTILKGEFISSIAVLSRSIIVISWLERTAGIVVL
jgi:hypothetical protein